MNVTDYVLLAIFIEPSGRDLLCPVEQNGGFSHGTENLEGEPVVRDGFDVVVSRQENRQDQTAGVSVVSGHRPAFALFLRAWFGRNAIYDHPVLVKAVFPLAVILYGVVMVARHRLVLVLGFNPLEHLLEPLVGIFPVELGARLQQGERVFVAELFTSYNVASQNRFADGVNKAPVVEGRSLHPLINHTKPFSSRFFLGLSQVVDPLGDAIFNSEPSFGFVGFGFDFGRLFEDFEGEGDDVEPSEVGPHLVSPVVE